MIEVHGLVKRFGRVTALDHMSFAAADGEITGLLGMNGAGKSTALRILSTAVEADAGTARVDGLDVAKKPLQVRRRIGVLPHSAGLYGHLSARENIAYHAALHGLRGAEGAARVDAIIERLGLGEIAARRAKGFSQGQRIRVALARVLVHDPPALLLDEPTNGLDVLATRALREVIRERRAAGCCILFSSHVMQEVAALCDRIVIVADGRVSVAGSAAEVRVATGCEDLEDAFVAAVGGDGALV